MVKGLTKPFLVLTLFMVFHGLAMADIVNVSPTSLDFGDQVVTTSAIKGVVLSNPTKKTLTIFAITATGDFSYQVGTCGSTLAPEGECTINVRFAPAAVGTRTGTLSVNDDASDGTQKVKLSGNGTPVQLLTIAVTPLNTSVPLGRQQQFLATGSFNNGTSQNVTSSCTWTSSATGVATVNSSGLASSVAQGTTIITAVSGAVSGAAMLTVTHPVVVSIMVTPANASIAPGATQQFEATATLSDGTSGDATRFVVWNSSAPLVAAISAGGLATGLSFGITSISATQSVTGSATLEVGGIFTDIPVSILRWAHTATLLNDGHVLLAGGFGGPLCDIGVCATLTSSDLFDPATQTMLFSGVMISARARHTATLLNNGTVLMAGGINSGPIATAEVFDPVTSTFHAVGTMATVRVRHTATLLTNGQVLVAGGGGSSAEIYDPATSLFTPTGSMSASRSGHTATLLNDGRVLVAGGDGLATAEVYDPAAGTFSPIGSMASPRTFHRATLLNSGKVLITGGNNGSSMLATTELFDLASGLFSLTGSMMSRRDLHTATLLTNGQVLVAGGEDSTGPLASAEKYDPVTEMFIPTGSMQTNHTFGWRAAHTATLLANGQVFVAGGNAGGFINTVAELYLPSTFMLPGLLMIEVAPANLTLAAGSAQKLVATGMFADGSTQTLASVVWISANPGVASVSNDAGSQGIAVAVGTGMATITASAISLAGPVAGTVVVTVP